MGSTTERRSAPVSSRFLCLRPPLLLSAPNQNCQATQSTPDPNSHLNAANRPFPSSPGPLFQNEDRCSAFDMEIIFHSYANKTHFHKKGCARSLILKVRVFGTRHGGLFCLREVTWNLEIIASNILKFRVFLHFWR